MRERCGASRSGAYARSRIRASCCNDGVVPRAPAGTRLEAALGRRRREGVGLAKQAVQSGRHDPDALWMAGYTLSVLDGDHVAAASAVNRALTLNPSSADAWSAKGWIACFRNQPGEGIEALHRAMRLSPLDPYEYRFCAGLALAHLVARRYEVAVEWVDRS